MIIEDGKLLYKVTHEPVHTSKGDRWIFVMSPCGKLYVAKVSSMLLTLSI